MRGYARGHGLAVDLDFGSVRDVESGLEVVQRHADGDRYVVSASQQTVGASGGKTGVVFRGERDGFERAGPLGRHGAVVRVVAPAGAVGFGAGNGDQSRQRRQEKDLEETTEKIFHGCV